MKKIKAVIFDLDGTLLDSLCDLHISVNAACEAHGFPAHTKDEVCSYVGNGVYKLIERAIPNGDKNEKFESTLAFFKEHYALHMYDHTGAYEGIYEALDTLLAEGYKLAVVSNKFDLAVRELCQRYFPRHIEVAIGECEAKGIKTIVIPKDRSVVVNDTVMKTSSGALSNVDIVMVNNLVKAIDKLKDNGYFVYGAEANGVNYKEVDYSDKVCLVIGSEGNGISRLVMNSCDEIISIPMRGKVNSLNASVAAAILIYGIGE